MKLFVIVALGVEGQSPSVHEARREPAAEPGVAPAISEDPQVMKPRIRRQGPLISADDPIELPSSNKAHKKNKVRCRHEIISPWTQTLEPEAQRPKTRAKQGHLQYEFICHIDLRPVKRLWPSVKSRNKKMQR